MNTDDPRQVRLACAVAVGVVLFVIAMIGWRGRKGLVPTILIASVFVFLAAMVIPSYFPARKIAFANACLNNLREIQMAKDKWAEENHKLPTDIPTEKDLNGASETNGFLRSKLVCPAGGKYTIGAVNENPTCSLADKGHKLE